MSEHPSLNLKNNGPSVTAESLTIANELLEQVQPIVDSRRKLKETEEEVKGLLTELLQRFEALTELKKENLQLEKDVLTVIKTKLS